MPRHLMDDQGHFLSPEEILFMSKTEQGRRDLKRYILAARTAMSIHEIFHYLEKELQVFRRPLSEEEQQNCCNIMWNVFFNTNQEIVFQFVDEMYQYCKQNGLIEDFDEPIASC